MNEDRNVDVHAETILKGLTTLGELLEKPVAREALDVTKNAATASQYDILRRLTQSLKQYLQRDGDLFYVGLLGHFSAGKSSTINSLLSAWNTKQERNTGLNPTDTTITLITQEKNAPSLLGVIREGRVPIRYQAAESALLENLVIVDTPGTGDPHLIEEIAREFLPICDVLLFVFSAANPLDKTDVPLLTEIHRRLQFIPIRFVITRADELRLNSAQEMSSSNIDVNKQSTFLSEVILRVSRILTPIVYTEDQFVLIDNKSGYNIDLLREYLLAKCDSANPHARITMHANKLQFYLSGAKELRGFFAAFLDIKLKELNKIVAAADRNIQKYNEIVRISNSNLTKAWMDQHASINDARTKAITKLRQSPELPNDYTVFGSVMSKRVEIVNELVRESQHVARTVSSRLRINTESVLREYLHEAVRKIMETGIDKLTATSHGISTLRLPSDLHDIDLMPESLLARRCDDLRSAQANALEEATGELRRLIEEIEKMVLARMPILECVSVAAASQMSLTSDLNQFFQNVELYRDGVFSHTTKESISTLGIGRELDTLESEFTEDDKAHLTGEAVEDLFPHFRKIEAGVVTKLGAIAEKVRPMLQNLKATTLERPDKVKDSVASSAQETAEVLQQEIARELQADSDKFCESAASSFSSLLVNTKSDYDSQMQTAKEARARRYLIATAVTGLVTLASYLGYRFLKSPAPQSMYGTFFWSVIANLVGDIVGFAIAKFRDKFPKKVSEIRERFNVNLQENAKKLVETQIRLTTFATMSESNLTARLNPVYLRTLAIDSDGWHSRAAEYLRKLRPHYANYAQLRKEYVDVIDETWRQYSRYFNDAGRNLEVLNTVADRIKRSAIEPSFSLLAQTRQQLENVKKDIEAVEFS